MKQLIISMSLPLMISLLIQSLYNIVDSIFIAMISEDSLTATSLAYPMQLLMVSVSVGTSVGINAVLSRSFGARSKEQTTYAADSGLILALAGMTLFMIIGLTGTDAYVRIFTSDLSISADCSTYLRICMILCGGLFIGTMYQRFLQAVGNTFDSMVSLISGAITNLILDPIFIFGLAGFPEMGIRGAAIATVTGQWVSAVAGVVLNKVHNPAVKTDFKGFRLSAMPVGQIYRVALPTIIMQALGSIMVSTVNGILIRYTSAAVAFWGVYYKLQSFLFMPIHGMGQAAIPITGYSYGAKRYDRISDMLHIMLPAAVSVSLIFSAVFYIFPHTLIGLFSPTDDMLEVGIPALRIIGLTFAFASVSMILGYTVSGLGDGMVNMMSTAIRQLILLVPFMALFAKFGGVSSIWYAFWIAEPTATLYAILSARKHLQKIGVV